jgi:hypothetical protein
MSRSMEMPKRQPTILILLAAAGAAAGYLIVRKAVDSPSVSKLINKCEDAAEALDHRLCNLSGLFASDSAASR